ncbi:MAG: transketolase family protein [Candidatus Nomurabacteria bacterium]|jgi:transketolase|nr:transketolase family protein [Candidatus Nomurabacteria bacterium]
MSELKSVRQAFGRGLTLAAEKQPSIVALVPDLTNSIGFGEFAEKFPERFIQTGIAEQNIVCVASGLAHVGKTPFMGAYAAFSPGRNWEQIRTTICINDQPVKIIGSHAGLTVGPDGETHQALEDIALMRVLPNMSVFAPADAVEAEQMALVLARYNHPAYVRYPRADMPLVFDNLYKFEIGKSYRIRDGRDVVIFTTGTMLAAVLEAAELLKLKKIDAAVVHFPTIKPLDEKSIVKYARKFSRVITVEEHQIAGGFGSAVAEVLSADQPTIQLRIGVNDQFGQSAAPDELLDFYGLTAPKIAKKIKTWYNV